VCRTEPVVPQQKCVWFLVKGHWIHVQEEGYGLWHAQKKSSTTAWSDVGVVCSTDVSSPHNPVAKAIGSG
jgi:hypothetical protein